jgi:hypothetical protein
MIKDMQSFVANAEAATARIQSTTSAKQQAIGAQQVAVGAQQSAVGTQQGVTAIQQSQTTTFQGATSVNQGHTAVLQSANSLRQGQVASIQALTAANQGVTAIAQGTIASAEQEKRQYLGPVSAATYAASVAGPIVARPVADSTVLIPTLNSLVAQLQRQSVVLSMLTKTIGGTESESGKIAFTSGSDKSTLSAPIVAAASQIKGKVAKKATAPKKSI